MIKSCIHISVVISYQASGFIKTLKSTLSGPGLEFIRIKFSSTDITLLNTYEFTLV